MKQTKLIIPKSYILLSLKLEPKGILLKTSDASSLLLFDENTTSTGSSLVFPLRKLSNSYIISTLTPFDDSLDSAAQFAIAATKDDTQVSITFKMDVDRKIEYDGRAYRNGDVMHLTMHRLRTFQVVAHKADLTGTTISASYPAAVFSGNKCNRLDI
ncbi:uncharacterized protein LOC134257889 [Saccostrea cucullata]|uniref:uncharacterized protein LOC134257889 n=1 Tax=Saccostrea cuccullata TaxID=36930 RepID=UPI002ED621CB